MKIWSSPILTFVLTMTGAVAFSRGADATWTHSVCWGLRAACSALTFHRFLVLMGQAS